MKVYIIAEDYWNRVEQYGYLSHFCGVCASKKQAIQQMCKLAHVCQSEIGRVQVIKESNRIKISGVDKNNAEILFHDFRITECTLKDDI